MPDQHPPGPHAPIPESTKPWEIEFTPADIESGLEEIEHGFRSISKPRTYGVWWIPRRDWLRNIRGTVTGHQYERIQSLLGPHG